MRRSFINAISRSTPSPAEHVTTSVDMTDPTLPSSPVARYSRGYLRHLLSVDEPTAGRLLTLHNLAWVFDFIARMRRAIVTGGFDEFRRDVHAVWGDA